jgi:hypothetical protein
MENQIIIVNKIFSATFVSNYTSKKKWQGVPTKTVFVCIENKFLVEMGE